MSKRQAILIGATGLVGQSLLKCLIDSQHYANIISISRRPLTDVPDTIQQIIVEDFKRLSDHMAGLDLHGADAFSSLGTTQKQAGSKARFIEIDHDYNLSFATACKAAGVAHFLLLSATGANPKSRIFYNRVKGELERDLAALEFARLSMFQPSLLMGQHRDARLGEGLAQRAFQLVKPIVPDTWDYRPIEAARVAAAMAHIAISPIAAIDSPYCYSNRAMLELTLESVV